MKIYNNNSIMFLPNARYVVDRCGAVRCFGKVLNAYSSLNMSKQKVRNAMLVHGLVR